MVDELVTLYVEGCMELRTLEGDDEVDRKLDRLDVFWDRMTLEERERAKTRLAAAPRAA